MPHEITRAQERRGWQKAWLWGIAFAIVLAAITVISVPLYSYLFPKRGGQDQTASDLHQQKIGAIAPAAIETSESPKYGVYLTDGFGRALYSFEGDKRGERDEKAVSKCYGNCATSWPPLLSSGAPKVANNVQASLVSTTERKDGSMQVTYNGWPLYRFVRDVGPLATTGQNLKDFDAEWHLLTPSGQEVEANEKNSAKHG